MEPLTTPLRLSQLRAEHKKLTNQLNNLIKNEGSRRSILNVENKIREIEFKINDRREQIRETLPRELLISEELNSEQLEEREVELLNLIGTVKSEEKKEKYKKLLSKIEEIKKRSKVKSLEKFLNVEMIFHSPKDPKEKGATSESIDDSDTETLKGDNDNLKDVEQQKIPLSTQTETPVIQTKPRDSDSFNFGSKLKSSTRLSEGFYFQDEPPRTDEQRRSMKEFFENVESASKKTGTIPKTNRKNKAEIESNLNDRLPKKNLKQKKTMENKPKLNLSTIREVTEEGESYQKGASSDTCDPRDQFVNIRKRRQENSNVFEREQSWQYDPYKIYPLFSDRDQSKPDNFQPNYNPNISREVIQRPTSLYIPNPIPKPERKQRPLNSFSYDNQQDSNYPIHEQNVFPDNSFMSQGRQTNYNPVRRSNSNQDSFHPNNETLISGFPSRQPGDNLYNPNIHYRQQNISSNTIPYQQSNNNLTNQYMLQQPQNYPPMNEHQNVNPDNTLQQSDPNISGFVNTGVRHQFLRRLKRIPKFEGNTYKELKEFIEIGDNLFNTCKNAAEENEFYDQIELELRGEAKQIVASLPNSHWHTIRTKLYKHFSYLANRDILTCQLENLRQEKEESLSKYSERARKLLQEKNSVYNFLTEDQKLEHNRMARKAFSKGIQNTRLRNRLITRGASSLEDAIAYAIEAESDELYQIPRQELYCRFCRTNGHRENECRSKSYNNDGLNPLITMLQSITTRSPNRNNRNDSNRFANNNNNWSYDNNTNYNRFNQNWRIRNNPNQNWNRNWDNQGFRDNNNRFNNNPSNSNYSPNRQFPNNNNSNPNLNRAQNNNNNNPNNQNNQNYQNNQNRFQQRNSENRPNPRFNNIIVTGLDMLQPDNSSEN